MPATHFLSKIALAAFVFVTLASPPVAAAHGGSHPAKRHQDVARSQNTVEIDGVVVKRSIAKCSKRSVNGTTTDDDEEDVDEDDEEIDGDDEDETDADSTERKSKKKSKKATKHKKAKKVSSSSSKKVGLAWPNGNSFNINAYLKGAKNDVGWYYTWSPWDVSKAHKQLEFCPMLWGDKQTGLFAKRVLHPVLAGKKHPKCVMGFNEPNQSGQSDMSPEHAVAMWRKYMSPIKKKLGNKVVMVSPATTSAPSGKAWMKKFFKLCPDCHVDAVALHWYDVSASNFKSYVTDFHKTFDRPIWVTEFACQSFNNGPQCSADKISNQFFPEVTAWMQKTSWVHRYSAFGAMGNLQGVNPANSLMRGDGSLTRLAWKYTNPS